MLEIEGVGVRFGGVSALGAVSVRVGAGEAVGVLGVNGAGKTTLLRAIIGRVPVVTGTIRFEGESIAGVPTGRLVDRGLSLCPEGRMLFAGMSVEDNLLLGAHRATQREARLRLGRLYGRLPWLGERRRGLAGALSGGQQQMVAIGRALMASPRLLLLDEPSSGLSPIAIAEVRGVLASVRDAGTALLLVEQNVQLASAMTERGYLLARGAIEAEGATDALARDPRLTEAYLG